MELDATDWPLVRITQHGRWTPDALRAVLRLLDDLLERCADFAVAHDARTAGTPGTLAREIEREWIETRRTALERWCRGWAVCRATADDPVVAGPAGAQDLPTELRLFTDWDEAQAWALSRLGRPAGGEPGQG